MAVLMLRRFPRPCPRLVTKRAIPLIKQTSWVMLIHPICSRKSHAASINGCGLLKPTPRRPNEDENLKPRTSVANLRIPVSNKDKIEQPHSRSNKSTTLPAGATAPDFTLKSTPDQSVKLSDFRGRPVVLAFYPAEWSPVCGDHREKQVGNSITNSTDAEFVASVLFLEQVHHIEHFPALLLGIIQPCERRTHLTAPEPT